MAGPSGMARRPTGTMETYPWRDGRTVTVRAPTGPATATASTSGRTMRAGASSALASNSTASCNKSSGEHGSRRGSRATTLTRTWMATRRCTSRRRGGGNAAGQSSRRTQRAWRGLIIAEEDRGPSIASAYRLIVEGAWDHPTRSQNGVHESDGSESLTEAFKDVLATIVRADEVVALDAERLWSGEHLDLKRRARGRRA
jgi:hypothetical protein